MCLIFEWFTRYIIDYANGIINYVANPTTKCSNLVPHLIDYSISIIDYVNNPVRHEHQKEAKNNQHERSSLGQFWKDVTFSH